SGGLVAVAQAGDAVDRTPGGARTHGASQPYLWTVVPTDRSVHRDAAQAAGGAVAAVAGGGASERFERTEELGRRDGARLCRNRSSTALALQHRTRRRQHQSAQADQAQRLRSGRVRSAPFEGS